MYNAILCFKIRTFHQRSFHLGSFNFANEQCLNIRITVENHSFVPASAHFKPHYTYNATFILMLPFQRALLFQARAVPSEITLYPATKSLNIQ